MSWDPRQDGARCDLCPLRTLRAGRPVPAKWNPNALALFVGEAPGETEVAKGEPFVGKAGIELEQGLRAVGAKRGHISLTNAIACRPPENELEKLLHSIQKRNKAIAKENEERKRRGEEAKPLVPTPMECCRPRLLGEIMRLPKLVTLGKIATQVVLGGAAKIMDIRGGPREVTIAGVGEGTFPILVRVLPTLHPAFIMRSRRWRGAFRADLGRAFRWFTSGLKWKDPEVIYRPGPVLLRRFLDRVASEPFTVFDVESFPGFPEVDHYDPLFDRLKCIGIGTGGVSVSVPSGERDLARGYTACVIPFRSIESSAPLYSETEKPRILALVREYLTSPRYKKVGWNSRYYDRLVCERQLGVTPSPHLDAIGLHKLAEPELPHGLAYAGSVHTDVDSWKQGHIATTAGTDRELWKYNATDTVVTAQCVAPLVKACQERGQLHLLPFFARLQDVAVTLHTNGMRVNQVRRREWDRTLLTKANAQRKKLRELTGWRDFNPSSFPQVADLLFERLGIAPYSYTKLGDPSTEDDALRAFLSTTWSLDDRKSAIVRELRAYRKTVKRRGVVVRLRPITEEYYEAPELSLIEETKEEREERERRIAKGKAARAPGLVLPDGRVHADYNTGGTVGWRYSSSNPNMQNLEQKMRDLFEAEEGYTYVACDEGQLELRMVVGLAQCRYYMERFASGADPHHDLCIDTFGAPYEKAEAPQKKKLRRCVKELTYSGLYMAGAEVQLEVVTSAEDEKEQLLFPNFTLREVEAFRDNWHRRNPEIAAWWHRTIEEWKRDGFLAEPIMGLKCDFLDGEDPNALVNYRPQAGGAALTHRALFRALDARPSLWSRLVQQGHDSIVFEVKEEEGAELGKFLEECMKEDGAQYGLPVKFEGESKVGRVWKDV